MAKRKKSTHGGKRAGAGRKKIAPETAKLWVTLSQETHSRLTEIAATKQLTLQELLRQTLTAYTEQALPDSPPS